MQLYMTIAATYSAFIPAAYVFDYQMPWIGNADEGVEILERFTMIRNSAITSKPSAKDRLEGSRFFYSGIQNFYD